MLVPTLFFVSVLIFWLQQLLPGDPAIALAGEERDPDVDRAIRQKYHLDQPLPVRYGTGSGVLQGDLGESVRIQKPVTELILEKLPVTVQLRPWRWLIALVIGIPRHHLGGEEGHLVGLRRQRGRAVGAVDAALLARHHADPAVRGAARLAAGLGLRQPVGGSEAQPHDDDHAGVRARQRDRRRADAPHAQRHAAGAGADYVRTARAKGLPERVVVLKHALRNALIPIITLGAIEFGTLLSGAVLTEQVFAIPGFGKLIVDAVFNRDYAVVQGVVLFTATVYIPLNLLADVAYFLVNPRMRH